MMCCPLAASRIGGFRESSAHAFVPRSRKRQNGRGRFSKLLETSHLADVIRAKRTQSNPLLRREKPSPRRKNEVFVRYQHRAGDETNPMFRPRVGRGGES
jgi:hypothetical protein